MAHSIAVVAQRILNRDIFPIMPGIFPDGMMVLKLNNTDGTIGRLEMIAVTLPKGYETICPVRCRQSKDRSA